jgi:mannose-6-phosphate isomerase
MTYQAAALKLRARRVEKPWGRPVLPKPFRNPGGRRIGEIWFETEAGPALPLMIKYLLTNEKLSIQVHPCDAEAQARGLPQGKEECWLVLDAEPGACIGIGTLRPLSADELRTAAQTGAIETLIDWKPVQRGDFYYVPAGTVHAIGAGLSLIEIQQNVDITYRLYDYGRQRELHLDDGVAVSRAIPYPPQLHRSIDFMVDQLLVDGPAFSLLLTGNVHAQLGGTGPTLLLVIEGRVTLHGYDSARQLVAGDCAAVYGNAPMSSSHGTRLLLAQAKG